MSRAEIVEETVGIPNDEGTLEGRLAYLWHADPTWCCLIAGPHPMLGGDMTNNVVRALVESFALAGAAALSFNYGGVGRSEGGPADWPAAISTFWRDARIPEEDRWRHDTGAAVRHLRTQCPGLPLVLTGYSFGCWTAARQAPHADCTATILISPNPLRHDFTVLARTVMPLLILHSDHEIDCDSDELVAWFDGLRQPAQRVMIPAGEHFFRGREDRVVRAALDMLRDGGVAPERSETI